MSKSNHRWRFNVVPGVIPKGAPSEPLGCVKRPFDTEEEAQAFEPAQRPYRCSYCTKWHLTHHRKVRRHVNHDLPMAKGALAFAHGRRTENDGPLDL